MGVPQKFLAIGLLLLATLASGICLGLSGKPLKAFLSILHKLLAIGLVIFTAIRIAHSVRLFESRPTLLAAVAVLALSILAAFASGIVESIPGRESLAWLTVHRITSATAAIAAVIVARLWLLYKP
ncbi:MAG: hypothetical protein WB341_12960 [Terracidiphilus sp.]